MWKSSAAGYNLHGNPVLRDSGCRDTVLPLPDNPCENPVLQGNRREDSMLLNNRYGDFEENSAEINK
ncbi:unnamed protein product [Gongylonema pulchrum]|uniref:Uncharacterized protein n=1 Tax=Gongylonema pulchrum TaxID=637853 RepID=A0A183D2P2_9BILA|nr:unnamed protein product [Gongylonema pulchrum]